jgi:hypothetical protein
MDLPTALIATIGVASGTAVPVKAAVPDLVVGTVEVVYMNRGTIEPYVRVNVTTREGDYVYMLASGRTWWIARGTHHPAAGSDFERTATHWMRTPCIP